MCRKQKPQKGIMLITVLFLTVFLVMFGSAAMVFSMANQKHTLAFYQNGAALKTAEAGLNYAMSRLASNKDWLGFDSAEDPKEVKLNVSGRDVIHIIEHKINSDAGWVEGKVISGDNTEGYFEMYFAKPTTSGVYFGNNNNYAALIPDATNSAVVSVNNLATGGVMNATQDILTTEGVVTGQKVPSNSVLISVRGRVGYARRTIETAFRFTNGDYDSTAIGRGNVNITVCGSGDTDDINVIDRKGASKPSIIRSTDDMVLALDSTLAPVITGETRMDTTKYVAFDGNGSCEATNITANNITDPDILERLKPVSVNENRIPPLTKTEANKTVPNAAGEYEPITAGTYIVKPKLKSDSSGYEDYPEVIYYPISSESSIVSETDSVTGSSFRRVKPVDKFFVGKGVDVTNTFKSYISDGKMQWDASIRKLTVHQTLKVNQGTSFDGITVIKDLVIAPSTGDLLTVQIGEEAAKNAEEKPTCIQNDKGSVFLDAQVSGVGSIVCDGDLDMQAMSEYTANYRTNGLTIYAGGSIVVNEVDPEAIPYMEFDVKKQDADDIRSYNEYASINNKLLSAKKAKEADNAINGGTDKSFYMEDKEFSTAELGKISSHFKPDANVDNNDTTYDRLFIHVDPTTSSKDTSTKTFVKSAVPTDTEKYMPYDASGSIDYKNEILGAGSYNPDLGLREFCRVYSEVSLGNVKAKDAKIIRKVKESTVFKGLIFACKDFKIDTPYHRFKMEGMLVAAGKKTDGSFITVNAGDETPGKLTIKARSADFTYDPTYLSILNNLSTDEVDWVYWTTY